MARTKTTTGRKHKNFADRVAKNKVSSAMKFTDMKANVGQKFRIASAKMSKKMTHLRANIMLKIDCLQHPTDPVERVAATESVKNMKSAAIAKRRQKVAKAIDNIARKRALVREGGAIAMARHI